MRVEEIVLSRMEYGINFHISREFIDDFAGSIRLETHIDKMTRDAVASLKLQMAGQTQEPQVHYYPKDWVEALKERFAPRWLLRRWPIKFKYIKFEPTVLYPGIKLPERKHFVVYKTKEWESE